MRVVQRGGDLCFAFKSPLEILILAEFPADDFHRHGAVQFQIRRAINHALPALAEDSLNLVIREYLTHAHPCPASRAMNLREDVLI